MHLGDVAIAANRTVRRIDIAPAENGLHRAFISPTRFFPLVTPFRIRRLIRVS